MLATVIESLRNFLTPGGFWMAVAAVAGVVLFASGKGFVTFLGKRKMKKAGLPVPAGKNPLDEPREYLPTTYPGKTAFPKLPLRPLEFQWHSDLLKRWAVR